MRRRAEQADDRRVAVVQLRHRVEEVGDEPCAALHGGGREPGRGDAVPDGEDDAAAGELVDGRHHAVDLGRGGDDAHADVLVAHEPVLVHREVVGAVDFLEGLDVLLCGEEELRLVRAALGELDEGALGVPAEERCGGGGAEWAQEVEELGIQRTFLRLKNGREWSAIRSATGRISEEMTGEFSSTQICMTANMGA